MPTDYLIRCPVCLETFHLVPSAHDQDAALAIPKLEDHPAPAVLTAGITGPGVAWRCAGSHHPGLPLARRELDRPSPPTTFQIRLVAPIVPPPPRHAIPTKPVPATRPKAPHAR
jgi:hypothetical protein